MRQSFIRKSALLAVFVAACSEPTATNQGLAPSGTPRFVTTVDGGQLNILAGNNEIAAAGAFTYQDASIQVLSPAGAGVAGATVTFTTVALSSVTRSQVGLGATCSATLGNTFTTTTNASGVAIARWCYVGIGGQQMTVTYGGNTVTFNGTATTGGGIPTFTKVQGDAAGTNNATMAGQVVPQNPVVRVVDDGGTASLASVQVTFTANSDGLVSGGTCANCGSSIVTTNSVGQASVSWRLRTSTGASTLTASIPQLTSVGGPVTPAVFSVTGLGLGTAMACVSGCSDFATDIVGNQFGPKDPAVAITKADGSSVGAGVGVTVTYGSGTGLCGAGANVNGQTNNFQVFTNTFGVVAVPWCVAGSALATRTITFTAGGLSTVISASEQADFTTGNGSLTIDSGTGFTCTVAGVATPDLAVTFHDAQGAKIPGASITFSATDNASLANGSSSGSVITVTTNSAGQAAARFTCGTVSGTQTINIQSSTSAATSISGTAVAGAAVALVKIGGDVQTATAGTNVARNPTIVARDQFGNLVDGVTVFFTPAGPAGAPATNAGRGSVTGVDNCGGNSCKTVVTGSQGTSGNAAVIWTLSSTAGANTLTASAAGIAAVTFTATGN